MMVWRGRLTGVPPGFVLVWPSGDSSYPPLGSHVRIRVAMRWQEGT